MLEGGLGRVVILTAIRIEYQAIRAHLANPRQEEHPSGTIYERGTFQANDQTWDVLIVEAGSGNARATAETVRAIEHFKPGIALFVGVAGGLKDVKLGDVVAATRVYGYESGKTTDQIFQPRPDVRSSTHRMEQRARAEAKKEDWLKRLGPAFFGPATVPRVHVAPIASGNQVVASSDSAVLELIRANYGDAVAIEMEGYGFLEAVHAYPHVDALIIRGISDLINDKSDADARNFQGIAAHCAAAFAFEILAKLDVRVPRQREQATEVQTTVGDEKADEAPRHEGTIVDELQTPSQEDLTSDLLRGFHAELPGYAAIIEDIVSFLEKGTEISPAWRKSVVKRLDTIDNHVQRLHKDAPGLRVFVRVILIDIHDQIGALKSELQAFRHPHWFGTPGKRQVVESAYEHIRTLCKILLTDLGQFNRS